MKTQIQKLFLVLVLWNATLAACAQGTAFTYQGRLNENGSPATGIYDVRFTIYDLNNGGSVIGGSIGNTAVGVSNGVFAVTLDFGAGVFTGAPRWLEIGVRTNGSVAAHLILSPRQALTPSPYAIYASTASNVINGSVVKSLNNLKDNVTLAPGANVTITTNGNTLTLAAAGVGGSGIWSVNNNNAYYTAGNVGIGTSTPAHRLSLAGGPAWTANGWLGSVDLPNSSAIAWGANAAGQRFGMGHSSGGFYLFRTASNPGTTGSPALYDLVVDDSGNVGIGTTAPTPGVRLEVNGTTLLRPGNGTVQVGSPNAELGLSIIPTAGNRADLRFDGSVLKLVATTGQAPPSAANGLAITTGGNVGIGTATPEAKLHAETSQAYTAAVYGKATGTGGVGVYGQSAAGAAVYADGNAAQPRDKGGFVKAMAFIDPFLLPADYVVRGYNSQVAGNATSTITMIRTSPGSYRVDFGFDVRDRFISVTARFNGFTIAAGPRPGFNTQIEVGSTLSDDPSNFGDVAFFIFVY